MAAENKANSMREGLAGAQKKKEQAQAEVDELQEQLKAMQSEYEDKLKAMQAEGQEETNARLQRARDEIRMQLEKSLDSNMSNMGSRYMSQAQDRIANRQTDVLRINKIFRDVSRALGMSWQPVYEHLTVGFSPQVTDLEMAKIESQKPVMQAYTALMSWKQLAGQDCNMGKLAEALRSCSFPDIADMVLETMASE